MSRERARAGRRRSWARPRPNTGIGEQQRERFEGIDVVDGEQDAAHRARQERAGGVPHERHVGNAGRAVQLHGTMHDQLRVGRLQRIEQGFQRVNGGESRNLLRL